ncbi:hypothetical protein J1N35_006215 [Gossypium stocksii]|uniref:Ribosomal protein S11 n=1 Tax=Gossypium stocksii TaxID=47602 RepID=A0A9D3WGS3_9ROSI|nr:hypothetical protein J1N35_006215 [Gossypium stocksii]
MAKPIPKVGSRKNRCCSAQKSARRIPKGVIHVQASFNNTIVTVTDVRGQMDVLKAKRVLPHLIFYFLHDSTFLGPLGGIVSFVPPINPHKS